MQLNQLNFLVLSVLRDYQAASALVRETKTGAILTLV